MTNEHPITPPPRMVQDWVERFAADRQCVPEQVYIANRAAQWGADQELEACRQWLEINGARREFIDGLRAARRPKPPSLKQKALTDLSEIGSHYIGPGAAKLIDTIRRALEALPDD